MHSFCSRILGVCQLCQSILLESKFCGCGSFAVRVHLSHAQAANFAVLHFCCALAEMVHGDWQDGSDVPSGTSLMFKLACKMTQDSFLEELSQLCGFSNRNYNFVHLPWKQLAIVNFTSTEACEFCFLVMKRLAGAPGVCVANVQGGMHQGLEANLAYFCAKCSHQSDYKTLPMVLMNGTEMPLTMACRLFVSDTLLDYYRSQLPTRVKSRKMFKESKPRKPSKTDSDDSFLDSVDYSFEGTNVVFSL